MLVYIYFFICMKAQDGILDIKLEIFVPSGENVVPEPADEAQEAAEESAG